MACSGVIKLFLQFLKGSLALHIYYSINSFRTSAQKMEATGCVNMKFIVFLKGTLGKMVSAKLLTNDFINLQFWQKWPQKFYNVKSYNNSKEDIDKEENRTVDNVFDTDGEDDTQEHQNAHHHHDSVSKQQQTISKVYFFSFLLLENNIN